MRKHGGPPSRRDKHVTLAAISPPGVARGRFVGGQQSGLAGCKPPPLFTRGASSCSSQGRRQGEPWGASPRPSAPTYLSPPLATRLSPRRFSLSSAPPPVPLPSPRCPRPLPGWVGEKGVGGGASSLSVLWRKHVASTSQARGAALVPLLVGGGACRVARVIALPTPCLQPRCPPPLGLARRVLPTGTVVWSVPHPLSAASPPYRLVLGGGGRCPPLPTFTSQPWGGGVVLGGGALSSSLRCTHVAGTTLAGRRHEARHLSLCRGGGHALWLPSSPFLPCVRTPGGPPVGACTARALFGHGRVVRPAPSRRCLPTLPLCPRGGGACRPPLPASITLGGSEVCVGGGGALVVFPS